MDTETLFKFKAASETRGPRLKVQADGATWLIPLSQVALDVV